VSAFVATTVVPHRDDTVKYVPIADTGHSGLMQNAAPVLLRWISARVDGEAPSDSCRQLEGGW